MNGFLLDLIIQHDREDSMVLVKKTHSKWYICRLEQIIIIHYYRYSGFKITTHVV